MLTHTHTLMYTYTLVHTHTHTHPNTNINTQTQTLMHKIQTIMHKQAHVDTHVQKHKKYAKVSHTHTHTHTHLAKAFQATLLGHKNRLTVTQTEEKKATSIGSGMQTESRKHSSSLTEAIQSKAKRLIIHRVLSVKEFFFFNLTHAIHI